MKYEPIKLKFKSLNGISANQIEQHFEGLYKKYVAKLNEINERLTKADYTNPNATYSEVRELKLEQTFALDAVILHEHYFNNLGGDGNPKGNVIERIKNDFGSFEAWKNDFNASGMSARGWVVLRYNKRSNSLNNISCDAHNQGGIWNATPLLVLDVYEHAYMIDFGVKRKDYLDAFWKNIDWNTVNDRFESLKRK
ncbi:MAG: superoxide dismutase [Thermoplasmata archaeon]